MVEACLLPSEAGLAGCTAVVVPTPAELAAQKTPLLVKRFWEVVEVATASAPEPFRAGRLVVLTEALPRSASGQLDRERIAALAAAWPRSLNPEPTGPLDPRAERLLTRLEEVLEAPGPYRIEHHLELDLALDSLDLVQLRLVLAEEFGAELSDEELWRVQTMGDVVRAALDAAPAEAPVGEGYDWPTQLRAPAKVPLDERFTMDRSGLRRWCASLGMLLIALFARLWFRLEVRGKERLPDGPFLLCPNHQSLLDSPLVYGAFPLALVHRLVFVAYGPYFHEGPLSILVRMGRLILTGEADNVGDSMRCAYDALQRGWSVVIFPEGNCSFDGSLLPAFPGVGLLACEAQVPVVPVLYEGSGAVCSPRHPGFGRAKITITVGEPFAPPPREGARRAEWQGVAERWREEVLALRTAAKTSSND